MDIDDRLEKLTARHEALAQALELMARMHEDDYRRLAEAQLRNEEAIAKSQVLMVQLMENVNSLARIAHVHEQRISNLEP